MDCGGELLYAARAIPQINAIMVRRNHFRMETIYDAWKSLSRMFVNLF